jgi:hypothetical protein
VEALGTARLADEIPAQRVLTTVVPRQEIADALKDPEGSPALLLDIDRRSESGEEEHTTISITWSRDELETLLERATSDHVVLTFDGDEIALAFDDVEAHGLRERAVVFAVAVAGALGSGAAIANATPISEPGTAGVVPASSTAPADQGSGSGLIMSDRGVLNVASAASTGSAASNVHTPGLQIGDEGAAPVQASAPSVETDTSGLIMSDRGVLDVGSAASGSAAASNVHTPGLQIGDEGAAPVQASAPSVETDTSGLIMSDRGVIEAGGATQATAGPGRSSGEIVGVPTRDLNDALIAGGVLLAIAGATFVGARRVGTARPV